MKWINNGIKYNRGCYECLICRFNNSNVWFALRAMATQQTQKSCFKQLAEYFDDEITVCEVKKMYDENDILTESEKNIIVFQFFYDETCHFYTLDGEKIIL